jgi:hypothetical protein
VRLGERGRDHGRPESWSGGVHLLVVLIGKFVTRFGAAAAAMQSMFASTAMSRPGRKDLSIRSFSPFPFSSSIYGSDDDDSAFGEVTDRPRLPS